MSTGVRILSLAAVAGFTWVCAALLLRWWFHRGWPLPQAHWFTLAVLCVLALAVVTAARPVRRAIRGEGHSVSPGVALRTLVLCQAAAITGALVTGAHLGLITVLWPDIDAFSVQAKAIRASSVASGGVVLALAGVWGQYACRLPDDEASQ